MMSKLPGVAILNITRQFIEKMGIIFVMACRLIFFIFFDFVLASCAFVVEDAPYLGSGSFEFQISESIEKIPEKRISFYTDEGTNMNIDVSPNGDTLVFDLLGDLYVLPVSGGQATPLTFGRAWDSSPLYCPEGNYIYFLSDRGGKKDIWRLTLSDLSLLQITKDDVSFDGLLSWSLEGAILLSSAITDPASNDVIPQYIDVSKGKVITSSLLWSWSKKLKNKPTERIYSAAQAADGRIYYSKYNYVYDPDGPNLIVTMHEFDTKSNTHIKITPMNSMYNEFAPRISNDGNFLAYFRQYDDRQAELRVQNRTTGRSRAIAVFGHMEDASYGASQPLRPNYAFTPDDQHIIFWQGGKILRVALADGAIKNIPFRVSVVREILERAKPHTNLNGNGRNAKVIRWPKLSSDGRTLVFTAIGFVWVMDLDTGEMRRLTGSSNFEYMPALSPDGKSVAFVSFAKSNLGTWPGRLMVANVDTGETRQILSSLDTVYLLPSWSPSGEKIALIKELRKGGFHKAHIGWTSIEDGIFHQVASVPASNHFHDSISAINAKSIAFDKSGSNILFSFRKNNKEGVGSVLAKISIGGGKIIVLANGSQEIVGITPSSDLKNIVLSHVDDSLWLVPFSQQENGVQVSAFSSDARRISSNGGYYVDWNGQKKISYGFGQEVFQYDLDTGDVTALSIKIDYPSEFTQETIVLKGARLITVSGKHGARPVVEKGVIVVNDGKISEIGPENSRNFPSSALIVDVTSKTIIPGLLDTHYHSIGGGVGRSAFKVPNSTMGDRSAIAYGVTTAWEPGTTSWNDGVPAAVDLYAAGRFIGPRWSYAGFLVGNPTPQLTSYADALAAVDRQRALGSHVLKLGGFPDNRKHRLWLSIAANQRDLGLVAHIDNLENMLTGIVDGQTGGDHSYIPIPFYKDVSEMLRQSGYVWTPNIAITSGSVDRLYFPYSYFWSEVEKHRYWEIEKFESMDNAGAVVKKPKVKFGLHRAGRVARAAADAARYGVNVGVSAHNKPGLLLHSEMWYMHKGGMPIADVLRAATMTNAEKLGLQEEVGSLEAGKMADFLILDDNPLDDILNTLSIKYTIQGGVIYDADTAERVDPMDLPLCTDEIRGQDVCREVTVH